MSEKGDPGNMSESATDMKPPDPSLPMAVVKKAPPTSLNPEPAAVDEGIFEEEDDDEDIDETLAERLFGLTEMFPEGLRNVTCAVTSMTFHSAKWLYSVGRVGVWVAASAASILALPIIVEMERAQVEEQQIQQQRQILLGPNAAVSGVHGSGLMPGAMPQVMPPGSAPQR